jgi:hypothetical protein
MLHPAVFTPKGSPDGTLDSLPPSSSESSVLSLTFSDNPFIDNMPATSLAPQQALTLPPPVQPVMADSKGSLQWEGSADDNLSPGQFLWEIDNKIDERNYTTERQKVNCMRNNIVFGSVADEWFGNLAAGDKDTYNHLAVAFELQWLLTAILRASKRERIQALKEWVLKLSVAVVQFRSVF